ncbi:hypothetical protein M413DRAFT_448898 [Hebeloma cylindrosporum]|uniref:Uncharacterized protein n=1 Tax=Hebeloma cylindrosporum TaxID=76867 RepID=A0A0C2XFS1_HEBCY|nr:hypothetical protein M413DRAFT_448898 [Hebeloma cylindrosporum h7]
MSISVKQLTQPSLYNQPHARTAKYVVFELLPPPSSNQDDYEDRGYLYCSYGTTYNEVLFPRKSERLVVSRPRKPQRRNPGPRTPSHKPKIQWPDARNPKDIATFYQSHLSTQPSLPDDSSKLYTVAALPALLHGVPVAPIQNKAMTHTREPSVSVVKPAHHPCNTAHPPKSRFLRSMNEA